MSLTEPFMVAGLDLSLTSTGIAVVHGRTIYGIDNIKSTGQKHATLNDRQYRISGIADDVLAIVTYDRCDLAVVESPSYGSRFGHPHDRSGLWWLVVSGLMDRGIPVATVAPQGRAKYATGDGRSKKDVVLAHVIERYTHLAGQRIPNDDVADAIVLAAMGARWLGGPIDDPMPEQNLVAMAGGAWPALSI